MIQTAIPNPAWRLKPWHTILLFGGLQAALTGFGTFFDITSGIGMYFVYIVGYFNVLVVLLPILLIKHFGVGTAIYLPWAVIGLVMEYYMEYIVNPVLISPWCVVGWCVCGLMVGLAADLAYRFLPAKMNERNRAILTGVVMSLANFLLFLIPLTFFYKPVPVSAPVNPNYITVAYYALPWLLLNSAFGGYTAWAICRSIRKL
jgi:hypothetical protein